MSGVNLKRINLRSFARNRNELVGIDFSGNNLKFAHARISSNKREVINLSSRDISGLADADISKVIRSGYGELGAKNPQIINIIPPHLVITKNIEIPSVNEKEIREIINLQAGRHTPYSREEIIVDYIDIGTYKNSYTKILLVIVARSVVKRQFEILDKAGLQLERVLLAPEGLAWSVSKVLKIETQDSPANVVHIDEGFTDFSIVFKNNVVFIRSIPIGTRHLLNEKGKYESRFVEELKNSLEAYQNEDIEKSPSVIILTGAVEELKDLEAVLNSSLHLPIKVMPYFKNLTISDQALKAASATRNLSFLNVIAPLLTTQDMKINLVPEEVKLRKSLEEKGRDLIKAGIFVLLSFVLLFSIMASKIYFKSAYLKVLNNKYQPLSQDAQKLEEDFTKVSAIKGYLAKRGYLLEILTELYNVTPEGLELNDIRFDEQGKFTVRGVAESMSTVFSFVGSMEKSKYFEDVKTKYTSKRKDGMKDVTDFEIAASLKKYFSS
jgi:type IV pilus assembly protein PilM